MYKENLLHHLKTAANLLSQKKFDEAKKIYLGILAEIPGQPDCYYGLYKLEFMQNNLKQAKAYFKEGLLKLSLSIEYDSLHKSIFEKWIKEYKNVFNEDIFFKLSDTNKKPLALKYFYQKQYDKFLEIVRKERDKELLWYWFEAGKKKRI